MVKAKWVGASLGFTVATGVIALGLDIEDSPKASAKEASRSMAHLYLAFLMLCTILLVRGLWEATRTDNRHLTRHEQKVSDQRAGSRSPSLMPVCTAPPSNIESDDVCCRHSRLLCVPFHVIAYTPSAFQAVDQGKLELGERITLGLFNVAVLVLAVLFPTGHFSPEARNTAVEVMQAKGPDQA